MSIHSHLPYDQSTSHARIPAGGIHLIASIDSISEAQGTVSFFGSTKALHGEVATTTAETSTHNHSNQQYSITAVTTSTGAIAERYAYSAYGEPTILDASGSVIASSAINNRYSYTGREWDATVGLHHFRARWVSPKSGRFLGRDPIEFDGSEWDLYEYCSSKPLNRLDPTGLMDWSEWPSEIDRNLTTEQIQEMINKETDHVKKEKLKTAKKIKQQFEKRIKEKVKGANRSNRGGRKGATCKGFLAKLLLFECEAACAVNYDSCLDKSLKTYEFCLQGAYSMDEPMQSNQVSLCDRVNTLDFIDCGATYVACGLGCLVGHEVIGGNEGETTR
jgi:RHS repeat-associated protein